MGPPCSPPILSTITTLLLNVKGSVSATPQIWFKLGQKSHKVAASGPFPSCWDGWIQAWTCTMLGGFILEGWEVWNEPDLIFRGWLLVMKTTTSGLIGCENSPPSLLSGFWIFFWTLPTVRRRQPNAPLPHWPAASPQLTGRLMDTHGLLWSPPAAVAARTAISTEPLRPSFPPSSMARDRNWCPATLPTQGMNSSGGSVGGWAGRRRVHGSATSA